MNAVNSMSSIQVDHDQKMVLDYISRIVSATGLTATEIAREAGVAASTLTRLYPAPKVSHTLSHRTLKKLNRAFPNVSFLDSWLKQDEKATDIASIMGGNEGESDSRNRQMPLYALKMMPFDAPVGSPAMPNVELYLGDFSVPCQFVPAPMPEMNVENLFAAYIPGDAMEPRYRAGEKIIVDRTRPPALKMDILVVLKSLYGFDITSNEEVICIGQLIDRTRGSITIWQHKTHSKNTFDIAEIRSIYTVVALIEG